MAYTQLVDHSGVRQDLIIRDRDRAIIPADPHNTDWQAYLAWLAAGNKSAEPPPAADPQPGKT